MLAFFEKILMQSSAYDDLRVMVLETLSMHVLQVIQQPEHQLLCHIH
jgi:hypothetical protein